MYDLIVTNARLYPMAGSAKLDAADSFAVTDGRIAALDVIGPAAEIFDARGRVVLPGFIDCHTHALYAGNRMAEHSLKLEGASYEELARAGGGILSTVRAVRAASPAELVDETLPRVAALAREGVTTMEIKSGYGLALAEELKMLRAIRELGEHTPVEIVPTFLGPHAVPGERSREDYLAEVNDAMLPAVAAEQLADTADIFVETIGFGLDEFQRYCDRAQELGFAVRAHTEQLSNMDGGRLAAESGALSCDHLEYADDSTIAAMARAGTTAVLLPGAFYFLRETRKPPVDLIRGRGVSMAVATDLNPGSSPLASLLACMHMATVFFGLTPGEALLGVTLHAARALGRHQQTGSIEPGKRANFCVWDLPEPDFLVYQLGGLAPDAVFIGGRRV